METRKHPHLTATRLNESQRATVDFAARLEGETVTEFLRRAALERAERCVSMHLGQPRAEIPA